MAVFFNLNKLARSSICVYENINLNKIVTLCDYTIAEIL